MLTHVSTRKIYWIAFIVLSSFALFSFRLVSSYTYDNDFARDLIDMYKIAHGHFSLLGPKSSFGGIFTGPYYYYLFMPILAFSTFNLYSVLFFNAFLFSVMLAVVWGLLVRKHGELKSFITILAIALLPIIIFSARNPGNAYSYIPFLVFFICYIVFKQTENIYQMFFLGFLGGAVISTHYSNSIVIFLLSIYILMFIKDKKFFGSFVVGALIAFTPLVFFELKHNFVMMKNTFFNKSFTSFTKNKNLSSSNSVSTNLGIYAVSISNEFKNLVSLPAFIYLVIGSILYKNVPQLKNLKTIFILACTGLVIVTILFTKFQYVPYYLFPISLLLFLSVIFLLLETRWWFLIGILILCEVITFPTQLYAPSRRAPPKFQQTVDYIIQQHIVEKNSLFNVMQVRPNIAITPHGFEYRYFFLKKGFTPLSETQYNSSKSLIIISEVPNIKVEQLSNWEIEQFGKQYLHNYKKFYFENLTIYKITK